MGEGIKRGGEGGLHSKREEEGRVNRKEGGRGGAGVV